MKKQKQKLIVIVGQTAVGKSDFAVALAKKVNAEIISADSRQVYAGAEIMSGAVTKSEMKNIPHHLISYKDIKKQYSVSNFLTDAKKSIRQISRNNKNIIICGGTAMYVGALVYGQVFPKVKPNLKLRKELSMLSTAELHKRLFKLDKKRAKTIDTHNSRRLIRAIEIATTLGKVPEIVYRPKDYDVLMLGLKRDESELKNRIKLRIEKRMRKGMLKEAKSLIESGVRSRRLEDLGLEFKSMVNLIKSPKLKPEILEKLYYDIWHFAKRQLTWWKRDENIIWLASEEIKKAETLATEFLKQKNTY